MFIHFFLLSLNHKLQDFNFKIFLNVRIVLFLKTKKFENHKIYNYQQLYIMYNYIMYIYIIIYTTIYNYQQFSTFIFFFFQFSD